MSDEDLEAPLDFYAKENEHEDEERLGKQPSLLRLFSEEEAVVSSPKSLPWSKEVGGGYEPPPLELLDLGPLPFKASTLPRTESSVPATTSTPRITTTPAPFPFLHSPIGSGYEPPVIHGLSTEDPFRNDLDEQEDSEESEDEVPASVRFELQPLAPHSSSSPQHQRHARHLSSLEPPMRNRFPSGFSATSPETLEPGGRFSRGRGGQVRHGLRSWARDLSFRPSSLLGGNASPMSSPNDIHASQRTFSRIRSWSDVQDLDQFLTSLYLYYTGKGAYCILLSQLINLLVILFIVGFSLFLFSCIDYSVVHSKHLLSDILYPSCMGRYTAIVRLTPKAYFVTDSVWWIGTAFRLGWDSGKLRDVQAFYNNVLGVSDEDISTIEWKEISSRIIRTYEQTRTQAATHGQNIAFKRLDAIAIANRILRKDNYLIALFNKDILDLSVPFLGRRDWLTQIIEWSLSYCILSYVFDDRGQVKRRLLKESNRARLALGLQRRFLFMGTLSLILAPLLFVFLILHFFFKYAQTYHKDPASLGARHYSPLARWKFREFNELDHIFNLRLNRSYTKAVSYLNQFPQEHIIIYAKFISFVAGSFAAVLLIATILNQDLLHNFEITPGYSSFFYITVFGGLAAASNAMIPPESSVYEPEKIGRELADVTHYFPPEWHNKMHTNKVRKEFGRLFENKVALYCQELISVLTAPYILCVSLPRSSVQIVDFFREFTLHVDTLGYVCSFAVFDFKRHGNALYGANPVDSSDQHLASKGGKMESSFLSFKAANPDWDPGMEGSAYLENVMSRHRNFSGGGNSSSLGPPGSAESMMMASEWSSDGRHPSGTGPAGLGQDLFRLLDAVYQSNRTVI